MDFDQIIQYYAERFVDFHKEPILARKKKKEISGSDGLTKGACNGIISI